MQTLGVQGPLATVPIVKCIGKCYVKCKEPKSSKFTFHCNNILTCILYFAFITGYKSVDSVPKLVEDYLGGKMMVDQFVTHNMPFTDINKAFDLMHAGER